MSSKPALFLLARAALATAILIWLLSRIDGAALLAALASAKSAPLIIAFILCVAVIGVAAWRWLRLLGLFGIKVSIGSLFSIVWIGQFFSMFLPGPLGDDTSRMVYISRLAPGRVGEACLSVLIDRCLGLCSVFVLCLFAVPLQWELLAANRQTFWLGSFVLAGGLVVTVVGVVFLALGKNASDDGIIRALPVGRLRQEILRVWNLAAGNKTICVQVLCAAVFVQLLNCVIFSLAGLAVGVHLPLLAWVNFVPVILAANMLPITIAGLGVREYLVVLFLGVANGVPETVAVASSLLVFASMVFVSAIGGLVFVWYRGSGYHPRKGGVE